MIAKLMKPEYDLAKIKNRLNPFASQLKEEVTILCEDGSSFELLPKKTQKPQPKFGSAKGLIQFMSQLLN